MTLPSPDIARKSARKSWLRRRLPRRPDARVSDACQSSVTFTRATLPIFACTSRLPHGSCRASSEHTHAR
jgi:hypothetical protein